MNRTILAALFCGIVAGSLFASILRPASASPDSTSISETVRSAIGRTLPGHCEIPCGIYDDHAEIERMRLDAQTMRKASKENVALADRLDATSLNTIARWVMVKEEHGERIQHTVAWYFVTQRVKAPAPGEGADAVETYHRRLAAFHAISRASMSAAQSLDPAAADRLDAAIDVVAPWYPASK